MWETHVAKYCYVFLQSWHCLFFSESENVLTPTAITECLEGIQFSFYGSNHVKEKYPSLEMKTLALCFSFPNIMIVVQGA
jgi:hypothetical protein